MCQLCDFCPGPLEGERVFGYVWIMASYPSPTSRSGRRFGVWRLPRRGFVRGVVWRLITRAVPLGRPGLGRRLRARLARACDPVYRATRHPHIGMNGGVGSEPRLGSFGFRGIFSHPKC
jgi:hypothetical protein